MQNFAYYFRNAWTAGSVLQAIASPVINLLIRVWIAQAFWISGFLKLSDWDTALYLAANEYPVSWMDPVVAAYTGIAIELLAPIFLCLGLLTRFAVIPIVILSVVIQVSYVTLPIHLFWVLLGGYIFVAGAGRLSLDHLFAPSMARSAVPFAAGVRNLFARLTRLGSPVYTLAMRLFIAAAVAAFAAPDLVDGLTGVRVSAWFVLEDGAYGNAFAGYEIFVIVLATALIVGVATRLAAFATALLTALTVWQGSVDPQFTFWLLLLALLVVAGAGRISIDRLAKTAMQYLVPDWFAAPEYDLARAPHVVIIGGGFGGLAVATGLKQTAVRVTVVDQHNYHLFQPLLYQVATAALSPADIAVPIRANFREQRNASVVMGRVVGVDADRQTVRLEDGESLAYDFLVLAAGARHSYFGRDEWNGVAPGLKRVDDATDVRRRILTAFELAETCKDGEERRAQLTFAIVGAGPTGVEMAGAIAELARFGMEKDFRNFDPADARVILVQSGERILPAFPAELSLKAQRSLERLGVEVRLGGRVSEIDDSSICIGNHRIAARTVIWAAGVAASPAAEWLDVESDRSGRIMVNNDLSVPERGNVYAIGDTAHIKGPDGQPYPGLAPMAKQSGDYVAAVLRATIDGRAAPKPFRYHHMGSLATIGRKEAVADFGFVRLSGTPAWWLWCAVHVAFLAGMRNRLSVMMDWGWAYLTLRHGTRLITSHKQ